MRLAIVTMLAMVLPMATPVEATSAKLTFDMKLSVITDKRERVKFVLGKFVTEKKQIACALNIAYKESRYNVDSHNKSSGARGVWQLLWGKPEWSLVKQTSEAHKYVQHRYETWCDAYRFHQERNWY